MKVTLTDQLLRTLILRVDVMIDSLWKGVAYAGAKNKYEPPPVLLPGESAPKPEVASPRQFFRRLLKGG